MIHPTSSAPSAQPVAPSKGSSTQKPAKPAPQPAATDSVQLSSAAQTRLAAVQELREAPAQTAQEAGRGDRQAQRLLAKEAAKQAK
jgi:hypothetical protein